MKEQHRELWRKDIENPEVRFKAGLTTETTNQKHTSQLDLTVSKNTGKHDGVAVAL